ncbi:hypothetical protein GCM10017771_23010 [Streptomyces capitiformicae]|uniref:Uncharacterized protein n=1 Tax=Streptomyces capitiformicae TaxID=2014920 RepID=A0A919L8A0_9ACTN|nr:hypothetical protein GCM10017771_23010 [Streptomyces capitiformicae]
MVAGGVADGEALELGVELGVGSAANAAGANANDVMDVNEKDTAVAEVTSRERLAVFLEAGTIEKVHGSHR